VRLVQFPPSCWAQPTSALLLGNKTIALLAGRSAPAPADRVTVKNQNRMGLPIR
jgi:hypothetical protein